MAVTLCVMLWAVPGHEAALVDYEDQVLGRLADAGPVFDLNANRRPRRATSFQHRDHMDRVRLV
jgi:hypothetical protein